jgi:hypothetical protein
MIPSQPAVHSRIKVCHALDGSLAKITKAGRAAYGQLTEPKRTILLDPSSDVQTSEPERK